MLGDCFDLLLTIRSRSLTVLRLVIDQRVAILATFDGLGDET